LTENERNNAPFQDQYNLPQAHPIPSMRLTELIEVRRTENNYSKKRRPSAPRTVASAKTSTAKKTVVYILIAAVTAAVIILALWIIGSNTAASDYSKEMLNGSSIALPRSAQYASAQGSENVTVDAEGAVYPPKSFGGGFWSVVRLGMEKVSSVMKPVAPTSEVEAGAEYISVGRFLREDADAKFVTDMSKLDTSVPGCYQIELDVNGKIYTSLLFVVDTVPPTAVASNTVAYTGTPIDAMKCFSDIVDETAVTASFETQPDFSVPAQFPVRVILEDAGKNRVVYEIQLTVMDDIEPPVISGAADRQAIVGDTVSYKEGVTVHDNKDGSNVALNVDISAVNSTAAGRYPVVYSATDSTGLSSSVTVYFTFITAGELQLIEELDRLVTPIYNSITNDSMTLREKARAIYNWTKYNISYSGYSDKTNWRKDAVRGLKQRSGDCFTYFAISKALLEKAGIPNIDVTKIYKPGRSRHYWSLIDVGTGWYHYDSTQWVYKNSDLFMLTDAQLLAFSQRHGNSHDFDRSLYPATPAS